MKNIFLILIVFSFNLASCQVKRNMTIKTDYSKIKKEFNGKWRLNSNLDEKISVSSDSIIFDYDNSYKTSYKYEFSKDVIYFNEKIQAKYKDLFLILYNKNNQIDDVFYFLGIDENEFSLMKYSTGESLVYIRDK